MVMCYLAEDLTQEGMSGENKHKQLISFGSQLSSCSTKLATLSITLHLYLTASQLGAPAVLTDYRLYSAVPGCLLIQPVFHAGDLL